VALAVDSFRPSAVTVGLEQVIRACYWNRQPAPISSINVVSRTESAL
jgi:hypothetical protein